MKRYVCLLCCILYTILTFAQKKVLFIGDSITDGKWGYECDGSRNTDDLNHIFGHGYMYLCASQYMSEYPNRYTFYNRGVSGNTISDLENRWIHDVLDINPDVISILVGINDVLNNNFKVDTLVFEKTYRSLILSCRQKNPAIQILIGEPFCEQGFRIDAEGTARRMCETLSRIVQRIAKDLNVVFIPYQKMFDDLCKDGEVSYWIWDGVHPTPAGHYKMAQLWKQTAHAYSKDL